MFISILKAYIMEIFISFSLLSCQAENREIRFSIYVQLLMAVINFFFFFLFLAISFLRFFVFVCSFLIFFIPGIFFHPFFFYLTHNKIL